MKSSVVLARQLNMFEIQINGKSVRRYSHQGNHYIDGRVGTEYSIKLQNNFSTRKLFVISVDGINVISGKPATDDPHNGYIVEGYDSMNLIGYRIDNENVASFKFVDSSKSYSKDITGSSSNVGVIGVRMYDELTKKMPFKKDSFWGYPNTTDDTWRRYDLTWTTSETKTINPVCQTYSADSMSYMTSTTTNISNLASKTADFDIGTGWGKKQTQKVKEIEFNTGPLASTSIVYYATKKQLQKMGIDVSSEKKIKKSLPSAFGEVKYCPIPKDWVG